ncbi:MAG: c-type cytochrome, partial [Proteobacteria bacterium]|nr:c-type cytochrome [Pseudomonadota bacterium]
MSRFYFLIVFIVFFIGLPQAVFSDTGKALFSRHCSSCHGEKGQGGKGPALRKEGLLVTVDLQYFENTMRYGRPLSGCPSLENKLDGDERTEIARYIKNWQKGNMIDAPTHSVVPSDNKKGRDLFPICGGCHGLKGEGAMGPP